MKSLAVRLGVSQPAPYRHFESREGLLAAVATDGFERFGEDLRASQADGPADEGLERAALAYLAFGRANRGVYRLMFASSLLRTADDEALARAAAASFQFLVGGVAQRVPASRVGPVAVWVWATLHGLVMLDASGLADGPAHPVGPAQVVHEMMATLFGTKGER